MFQDINVGRDRQDRRRKRLPMDKALLGVEWRFLSHASDDEPGFSTAWLQQKSLRREADCREREYRNEVLAEFADEFGLTSILPSRQVGQAVNKVSDVDDADEDRDDVPTPLQTAPDASLLYADIATSPKVPEDLPTTAVAKAPPVPALVVALKKGGVRMDDLQVGDTRHAEYAGSWDGVDLATAPCLRRHIVGDDLKDVECSASKVNAQESGYDRPGTVRIPVRPSTPPTLLVYKPCSSIKIADDVPSELQAMPKLLEALSNRVENPSSSESAVPQPSSEKEGDMERGAIARLKVGFSMNQLSPRRPKGTRKRSGGGTMRKRSAEEASKTPRVPPSLRDTPRKPVGRATPYGKAWYIDPELWGLESSPQVDDATLNQQDDNAEGAKQLRAHAKLMKEKIPALFSAIRFAKHIREQGVRMPAHLESTEKAIEAEEARAGQRRRPRTTGQGQDGSEDDMSAKSQENRVVAPGASRKRVWRARMNAAVILKKEGKRLPREHIQGNLKTIGTAPRDKSGQQDEIRPACSTDGPQ